MTKRELVEKLGRYPDEAILFVDDDDGMPVRLAGILYTPPMAGDRVSRPPMLNFTTYKEQE